MVRRRMWFRTRSVIARDMSPTRARSSAAPRGDESARSGADADSVDVGGPAVVRFAEDTVYERELPNKRWRVTASTRAAPHWARQYFADCAACEISPVRAVAVSCALAYFTCTRVIGVTNIHTRHLCVGPALVQQRGVCVRACVCVGVWVRGCVCGGGGLKLCAFGHYRLWLLTTKRQHSHPHSCCCLRIKAFLAAPGVSAFERQSRARLLLAGKDEWPPDSPATAAANAAETVKEAHAESLNEVATELQTQLVRDTSEFGHAEAAEVSAPFLHYGVPLAPSFFLAHPPIRAPELLIQTAVVRLLKDHCTCVHAAAYTHPTRSGYLP
jgi:hypothetical protein